MPKAIVYYSKTGNTRMVSEKLNQIFQGDLKEIKAESDQPYQPSPVLTHIPEIQMDEHIIFACPVHGFMLPTVMKAYLDQLNDLSGKTIDCFVTHHFPFAWLGGNQALRQMKRIIEKKHGNVFRMTSINWSSRKRDDIITKMIDLYKSL